MLLAFCSEVEVAQFAPTLCNPVGCSPSGSSVHGILQARILEWVAILQEEVVNPEYSLEGLMLKLKLQYFGHLMQRADSLEKTLMLGKTEGRRRG